MPRGGARPGAGRKVSLDPTVQVNWRVSAEAQQWLKAQAMEQGTSIAAILDAVISSYKRLSITFNSLSDSANDCAVATKQFADEYAKFIETSE
ncbi:MAG: hypothetical protein II205_05550 [Bacteroidales bacterium]|nr:hypothetical protein [Bacteroidales bacterium]